MFPQTVINYKDEYHCTRALVEMRNKQSDLALGLILFVRMWFETKLRPSILRVLISLMSMATSSTLYCSDQDTRAWYASHRSQKDTGSR